MKMGEFSIIIYRMENFYSSTMIFKIVSIAGQTMLFWLEIEPGRGVCLRLSKMRQRMVKIKLFMCVNMAVIHCAVINCSTYIYNEWIPIIIGPI